MDSKDVKKFCQKAMKDYTAEREAWLANFPKWRDEDARECLVVSRKLDEVLDDQIDKMTIKVVGCGDPTVDRFAIVNLYSEILQAALGLSMKRLMVVTQAFNETIKDGAK